jgi:hypothetical protein
MSIKYINIFQFKFLQNLPKLGFLVLKINHLATRVFEAGKNLAPKLGFWVLKINHLATRGLKREKIWREKNLAT